MQMFQKGRSMIEMLGVLAIIGVLSIGGLLGYRRAVNNHQANVILDDVNRFAFVILERSGLALGDIVPKGDFVESGLYTLEGYQDIEPEQFSITVFDVPKGVCESLLPKAATGYKVRVNEHGSDAQGMVYDAKYQDLCQQTNDIVLYFGDTAGVCNPAQAGKGETNCGGCRCDGYCVTDAITAEKVCCDAGQKAAGGACIAGTAGQPCTSNAGCLGGEFCLLSGGLGSNGTCTSVGNAPKVTLSNGQTWVHRENGGMYWDSAQNWCEALGLQPASRKDLGCNGAVFLGVCDTDITKALYDGWSSTWYHWLDQRPDNNNGAYTIAVSSKLINQDGKTSDPLLPLCFTP